MEDHSFKFHAKDFMKTRRCETIDSFYRLGKTLGHGAHGSVYACTHVESGAQRAVKVLEKSEGKEKLNRACLEEYQMLKDLDHPNLIHCYELLEDDKNHYIVTDLCCQGDLLDELEGKETGTLPEEDVVTLMNALLSCVNYFHSKNIVHRDLKLENILLHDSDYSNVKIIDFGLSKSLRKGQKLSDTVGTPYYVCPEMLCKEKYDYKCDVWSVGVIAFMLLGGYPPFDGDSDKEIFEAIEKGELMQNDQVWEQVSDEALEFILFLLEPNASWRPTAAEALEHPWLAKQRETTVRRCATRRSSLRSSLTELKQFQSSKCLLRQAASAVLASQHQHDDEVKGIGRAFQCLDRSCSGELSKLDFQNVLTAVFGDDSEEFKTPEDEEALVGLDIDNLFVQVNVSRSGCINYSEFIGACLLQKSTVDESRIQQVFKIFDRHDKGYISRKDLQEVLCGDCNTIDKIIRQADRSGAGIISYEDFRAQLLGRGSQKGPKITCSKDSSGRSSLKRFARRIFDTPKNFRRSLAISQIR